MVAGKLLLESNTFRLLEEELPFFAKRFESIIETIAICRKNGDQIFGKGNLCELHFLGKPFYEFYSPSAFEELKASIPDFTHDQFQFLMYELLKYDSITLGACDSLDVLQKLFELENNGLLGLECDRFNCDDEYAVYHLDSWNHWKICYLTKYSYYINWENATHSYLPNLSYSNKRLAEESQERFGNRDFYLNAGKIPAGEKNAVALEVGAIVAKCNFFIYDDKVSKLNNTSAHQRDVYSINRKGSKIYLSIDVENIAFEVFDHNGEHIDAYKFSGESRNEMDKTHKLKLVN